MRKSFYTALIVVSGCSLWTLDAPAQALQRHPRVAWEATRAHSDLSGTYRLVPVCFQTEPGLLGCRPQVEVPETADVAIALQSVTTRIRHPYPALYIRPYGPFAR